MGQSRVQNQLPVLEYVDDQAVKSEQKYSGPRPGMASATVVSKTDPREREREIWVASTASPAHFPATRQAGNEGYLATRTAPPCPPVDGA